jgi:thioredoxin 1
MCNGARRTAWVAVCASAILAGCEVGGSSDVARDAPIVEITTANFDEVVLQSDIPVLVDFSATWCQPCRQLEPIVADAAAAFDGRVLVGKVDVDESKELAARYRISGVPTLLLFKDGELDRAIPHNDAFDRVRLMWHLASAVDSEE